MTCEIADRQNAATVTDMIQISLVVNVPFAHHVIVPHVHIEAAVTVDLHAAIDWSASDEHLMSVDAVGIRHHLETRLGELIAGRMLIWQQEVGVDTRHPDLPKGMAHIQFAETITPCRPTIEALTLLTAAVVQEAVDLLHPDGEVAVAGIRFAESSRTAGVLAAGDVHDAASVGQRLWRDFL